jgi:homoserine dehydrogenase
LKLALIGFGRVGRAFARLLHAQRAAYPFRITGILTARHGAAWDERGLDPDPVLRLPSPGVEEFLDRSKAELMVEVTPLDPLTGQPAISHIRAAFARRMHVVTANKGPVAHAWQALKREAEATGIQFRFEAAVMDGAPVFNLVRYSLPAVRVLGFTAVLNSTTTVVIEAMERGCSLEEGIEHARRLGITEADVRYDLDGWDAAAKTAVLANVLMDADVTPLQIPTKGIGRLTPERLADLNRKGKTVRLVSRARRTPRGIRLRVRAEVLPRTDPLALARGASNLLLLQTDLMRTLGVLALDPGVEQTAYGLFSDVVAIAREA